MKRARVFRIVGFCLAIMLLLSCGKETKRLGPSKGASGDSNSPNENGAFGINETQKLCPQTFFDNEGLCVALSVDMNVRTFPDKVLPGTSKLWLWFYSKDDKSLEALGVKNRRPSQQPHAFLRMRCCGTVVSTRVVDVINRVGVYELSGFNLSPGSWELHIQFGNKMQQGTKVVVISFNVQE